MRTGLDLGVHVGQDLLEDDVDLGAAFVTMGAKFAQIPATFLAEVDRGDLCVLDHAGIGDVVKRRETCRREVGSCALYSYPGLY